MNGMLTDEDLTRLLGEAAATFEVPAEGPGFVLEELADAAPKHPRLKKRVVRLTAAAAAVAGIAWAVQAGGGVDLSTRSDVAGGSVKAPASTTEMSQPAGTTGGLAAAPLPTGLPDLSRQRSALDAAPQTLSPVAASVGGGATSYSSSAGAATAPQTGTIPSAAAPDAFDDGARIVKTGTIGLVVADGKVSTVVGKVRGIAINNRGYVADEKSQEYGDDPTSTLTLRVPVSTFERTVTAVRDQVKNGVGKVDTATTSGQDVTAQYADLQAQIQSLTAARNRFLTILSRANTIGETLSVQQRVDSTQLQIDRLEGQRRALAKQSEMATLTVTVGEKPKEVAKADVQSGLSRSWDDAKHGFSSGVEGLIARSGRALLVLIVGAVGLVVLRYGWRLARRRLV